MIEISPLVFLDKKFVPNEEHCFTKYPNGSFSIFFNGNNFKIKIGRKNENEYEILFSDNKKIFDKEIDIKDFDVVSQHLIGRPGVVIYFRGLPIEQLALIPRVLIGNEEKEYLNQELKDKRKKYEKEHGSLFK